MDINDIIGLSVEGAFSVLILTIAYKLYRSRIKTHSGCCLKENNGITLDSQNSGVSNENDVLSKI